MLQVSRKRLLVWGLAVLLVAIAGAMFFLLGDRHDLPAWIQAVGSILAILLAIEIQLSSSERAAAELERSDAVRLEVARNLATQIMEAAQELRASRDFVSEWDDWGNAFETLRTHYDQLSSFEFTSLKDPDVATALLVLLARLRNVAGFTRRLASKGERESSLDSLSANCSLLERTAFRFLEISVNK